VTVGVEVAVDRYAGFREFVEARSPALSRTAYLLTGDHDRGADLLQSALAKLLGKWRRVQAGGNPEGYVRRILYTEFVSGWRRQRLVELPSERLPERPSADSNEHTALRLSLEAALAALTPKQRAVIVLRFYEDRSIEEAAALLGCSAGTVKSQTNYALGRLRQLLPDLAELESSAPGGLQLLTSKGARS
jgi:RNA polymerase sigma-70 factor (sigma-E family)